MHTANRASRNRNGWTHRDVLRKAHPKPPRIHFTGVTVRSEVSELPDSTEMLAKANVLLVRTENEPARQAGELVRLLEVPS